MEDSIRMENQGKLNDVTPYKLGQLTIMLPRMRRRQRMWQPRENGGQEDGKTEKGVSKKGGGGCQ